jgi:hypothetical protein
MANPFHPLPRVIMHSRQADGQVRARPRRSWVPCAGQSPLGPMGRAAALICAAVCAAPLCVRAQATGVALAGPIFRQPYTCAEHWEGNLASIGDALGSDCVIQQMVEEGGRSWMRSYRRDGRRNEDWFGWNQEVLWPCSCEVVRLRENPVTNEPGVLGRPPASVVVLERADGVFFLLAHVQSVSVAVGDRVSAGQVIAKVGNNGMSRHPHIHIGAWRGNDPMQLRFDLHELGKLRDE